MSQHSALASLTAQYTDSEDEIENEEESSQSAVYILPKINPAPSPGDSGSSGTGSDLQKVPDVLKQPSSQQSSLGGLVSYYHEGDDLIDDDAVDDVYHSGSDSNPSSRDGLEDFTKKSSPLSREDGIGNLDGEANTNGENGGPDILPIEHDGDEVVPKKRSLMPHEPPGKCASELQEKFAKMLEKKLKGGLDMNQAIQKNKNFRNPSIYEKLIKYCDIDELGSNYPKNVFDPHEWNASSYYDELAKAQKDLMEKREKERKDRTKVDFVQGIIKKPTGPQETEPKRKSKWDQRGVMPPLLLPVATYGQPSVVVPTGMGAAAAAKGNTVINAFGAINKSKQK